MNRRQLKWWQVGLAAIASSALGGLSSRRSNKEEQEFYEKKLKQAAWAPPGWVFAPVWFANNVFLIRALDKVRVLKNQRLRKSLLIKQAGIWAIFFSFGYVYFKKKSTVLAALWTVADAALALSSYSQARKAKKHLANNYLPLLGWTSFASSVAAYQAYVNKDPLLQVNPKELLSKRLN